MPISNVSFVRATLAAILLGLTALLIIVGFTLWLVREARVYSDNVTTARLQRTAIVDFRDLVIDAETGQRGYLLTGNPDYLNPYLEALQNIQTKLATFVTLMDADFTQKEDASKIVPIVTDKLAELQRTVDLVKADKRNEALAVVRTNQDQTLMEEARKRFAIMLQRAEDKMDAAVRDEQQSIWTLRWVTIGGSIFIILVMGGSAWTVALYTRQLIAAQQEVLALNFGLEERVRERTSGLARANEEIQRFAHIVTHDLRAPRKHHGLYQRA